MPQNLRTNIHGKFLKFKLTFQELKGSMFTKDLTWVEDCEDLNKV